MAYTFSTDSIDPEFAGRAIEFSWLHKKPLLRDPLPTDKITLLADGYDTYELTDPTVNMNELGRATYREHAEWNQYETYEAYQEDYEEEAGPDELIDPELALAMRGPGDFPAGSAYHIVEPYLELIGHHQAIRGFEVDFRDPAPVASLLSRAFNPQDPERIDCDQPLGWVIAHDGPMPGSDYRGIEVSGHVALSCLQFVLDRAGAGIRIELDPGNTP